MEMMHSVSGMYVAVSGGHVHEIRGLAVPLGERHARDASLPLLPDPLCRRDGGRGGGLAEWGAAVRGEGVASRPHFEYGGNR